MAIYTRLGACMAIAAASMGLLGSTAAQAQPYPAKPVRIVVPLSPGGPVDVIARALGARLTEVWGQGVRIDNRPGVNEVVGAENVATSRGDGYTLFLATDPSISQNQFLYSKLPYDPINAFAPISRIATANMALFVPASLPVNNLKEFVDYAKARPGAVPYGSTGIGNATHLSMAWLENRTGMTLIHVPYKGLAPVIQDMLAGQVQAAFGALSVVEPYIKSGKLKALVISGAQRPKLLPTVPTLVESGFENIDANFTIGLFAPRGTPREIVNKVAADVQRILREPAFREKYIDGFAFDLVASTPDEFAAYIVTDRVRQEQRIKISGAKLD
ncbi:MAG: tripartite tricarboxylate transporter substrate binding protein [Rhodoferax sp.]|nr:tripartite tricarboxylate transporter substrate binding protein [Rhodoferax sp.]